MQLPRFHSTRHSKRPYAVRLVGLSWLCLWVVCYSFCWTNAQAQAQPAFTVSTQDSTTTTATCPLRCQRPAATTGARIFYLILVHDDRSIQGALRLFREICDPRHIVLIHVDTKYYDERNEGRDSPALQQLKQFVHHDCPCSQVPVRIESVHRVEWSRWSMNLPTLYGMQVATQLLAQQQGAVHWDVFVNLSGDNWPVYTPDTISEALQQLPYNFVTSSSCETGLRPTPVLEFPVGWHKRQHYTLAETQPYIDLSSSLNNDHQHAYTLSNGTTVAADPHMQIHFGSQWVILQQPFVAWVVSEMQRSADSLPSLLATHLQTHGFLMSDETFLATLLMYSPFVHDTLPTVDPDTRRLLWKNQTLSSIRAVRYERMDEHVPTAFGEVWTTPRYDVPIQQQQQQQQQQHPVPRPWGPYYLGVYDLAAIRASGAWFVRKVSPQVDANLYHVLPVEHVDQIPNISWPHELAVTPAMDWSDWFRPQHVKVAGEDEGEDEHDQDDYNEEQEDENEL